MLEGAYWEKNSSYVNMVINHARKEEETGCGFNSAALRSRAERCLEIGICKHGSLPVPLNFLLHADHADFHMCTVTPPPHL